MTIYKITNLVNGKVYVGQTILPVDTRWRAHCAKSSCKSGIQISYAIQKYGKDQFDFSVIEVCSSVDELNAREVFWIKELNSISPTGYNLCEGGSNGKKHEDTKLRISVANKGKALSEEHKKALSEARKKLPMEVKTKNIKNAHTSEVRQKISKTRIGVKQSAEHVQASVLGRLRTSHTNSNTDNKNIYFEQDTGRYRVKIGVNGKDVTASFSTKKYGDSALAAAKEFRDKMLQQIIGELNG